MERVGFRPGDPQAETVQWKHQAGLYVKVALDEDGFEILLKGVDCKGVDLARLCSAIPAPGVGALRLELRPTAKGKVLEDRCWIMAETTDCAFDAVQAMFVAYLGKREIDDARLAAKSSAVPGGHSTVA